jgi:hypothetical protein
VTAAAAQEAILQHCWRWSRWACTYFAVTVIMLLCCGLSSVAARHTCLDLRELACL